MIKILGESENLTSIYQIDDNQNIIEHCTVYSITKNITYKNMHREITIKLCVYKVMYQKKHL